MYVPAHAVADPNTAHTDADPDVYVPPHATADPDPDPDLYLPHADAAAVEPASASAEPGPVAHDADSRVLLAARAPGVEQR